MIKTLHTDTGDLKFSDNNTPIKLTPYDDGARVTNQNYVPSIVIKDANVGYVKTIATMWQGDGVIINSSDLSDLPVGQYGVELWLELDAERLIYPDYGFVKLNINENITGITGELVSSISLAEFQRQFSDLSSDLNEYIHSVAVIEGPQGPQGPKGDTGPQGIQGIQGPADGPNIPTGKHPLNRITGAKVANLSNLPMSFGFQEIIIDPRTGWRYGFGSTGSTDDPLEDLSIIEFDQYLRIRSSMKVTHGVNEVSWLHGQFVQFDYYNNDDTVVSFLIGGPGKLKRLTYTPDVTIAYDTLPTFLTVNETGSYTQAIDFDNNRVYSVLLARPSDSQYTYQVFEYSINEADMTTTFIKSYSDTFDIPDDYTSQGISAGPASPYLNRESSGTMLFGVSGGTNPDGSHKELSVRVYLIENGVMSLYSVISNLENTDPVSTSLTTRRSGYVSRVKISADGTDYNGPYLEAEGSSQTKIGDKWVFTTTVVTARDTNYFNGVSAYSPRNSEQYQLAFGDESSVQAIKSLGLLSDNNQFSVESGITNLYSIWQPGTYAVSPTLLESPTLLDSPYFLRGKTGSTVFGGSGIETITLTVSQVGRYGRVKQTLNVATYSATNHVSLSLSREIRTNLTIGVPNSYTVGAWTLDPIKTIGSWDFLPAFSKSTNTLLPGFAKFVVGSATSTFFADDGTVPFADVSGLFEVLPYQLPLDAGNIARILQRYTTYGTSITIYERMVTVNNGDTNPTTFPMGIGGGYPSTYSVGTWVKITN